MADGNKMYVGGLSQETTTEGLQRHFLQYGGISDAIVMVDKITGKSRGFGFVTFTDGASMSAAIGTSNIVDRKEVFCKKAVRENPAMASSTSNGMYNTVKVFVGGLPASCDHSKLTEYFGRFGQIDDAVVMMDSQTQRPRGFGYVTFSDPAAVEAVLQNYQGNQIDGKWVEVKRCIPQDKMPPGQSFKGKGKGGGGGGGGGGGSYGASGGMALYRPPATPNYPQQQHPVPGGCYGMGAADPYGAAYAGAYGGAPPAGGGYMGCYGMACGGAADPYGSAYAGAYGAGPPAGGGMVQGYAAPMSNGGYDRYAAYRAAPY